MPSIRSKFSDDFVFGANPVGVFSPLFVLQMVCSEFCSVFRFDVFPIVFEMIRDRLVVCFDFSDTGARGLFGHFGDSRIFFSNIQMTPEISFLYPHVWKPHNYFNVFKIVVCFGHFLGKTFLVVGWCFVVQRTDFFFRRSFFHLFSSPPTTVPLSFHQAISNRNLESNGKPCLLFLRNK